jgi:hypothetical protein
MPRRWTAVLARLGVPTGDGRILAPGGISSRDLPLPLLWQETTGDGHGGAQVVGRIESMSFDNGMVTATGSLLEGTPWNLEEMLEAGVIGPSVDLDDIEYVMDANELIVITQGRIAGATLVAIPAFADVSITLDPLPVEPMEGTEVSVTSMPGLLASVRSSGWSDMPMADEGRAWDGSAAANRVFSWATSDGETDWSRYARAFLRKDDDANPETKGAYGFGIADVIGGTLTIVPRGVFAAAAAVQGARTGESPEDAEGMRRVLSGIYRRLDRTPPWAEASLAASAVPSAPLPPLDWFAAPDLDRLTPLTISDTGRVFGHIAPWGQCHIGLPGCVTAPSSVSGYSYFTVGEQPCDDGTVVPVGTLVAGPRHADAQMAFQAAQAHYDDPTAAVAKVTAGEDEFGIWVAGWMLPGASPAAVETFRSSPVSGDWRRIGGSLEMIAVCSVNAPGFPIPKARVSFSAGHQRTLIGSFGITPVAGSWDDARTSDSFVATRDITGRAKWAWALSNEGR